MTEKKIKVINPEEELEKLIKEEEESTKQITKPIYKISTISGKECIPCAFIGKGGEIYTPSEAKIHLPDECSPNFDFGPNST
jgi:hypothetical protein